MTSSITASAKDWIAALNFVAPAVSYRPPAPVLQCIHVDPGVGRITGFDYEVRAETHVNGAEGQGKPFVASYSLLREAIMRTTKADRSVPVVVTAGKSSSGLFTTVSAAGYSIVLESYDVEEFPSPVASKTTHKLEVSGRDLKATIQRVGIAASKDDTLPILTGIQFIHEGNKLSLLATDRYRLALGEVQTARKTKTAFTFLLKAKIADAVAKRITASGDVTVRLVDGDKVRFDLPGGSIESLLVDGDYPKIQSLFPSDCTLVFEVERVPLLNASLTAGALAERNTPAVLNFSEAGVQVAFNVGLFDNSTSPLVLGVSAGIAYEAIQTAFNPAYLIPALKALTGECVRFSFRTPAKPALMTEAAGDGVKHLLMPVRLPSKVDF